MPKVKATNTFVIVQETDLTDEEIERLKTSKEKIEKELLRMVKEGLGVQSSVEERVSIDIEVINE